LVVSCKLDKNAGSHARFRGEFVLALEMKDAPALVGVAAFELVGGRGSWPDMFEPTVVEVVPFAEPAL